MGPTKKQRLYVYLCFSSEKIAVTNQPTSGTTTPAQNESTYRQRKKMVGAPLIRAESTRSVSHGFLLRFFGRGKIHIGFGQFWIWRISEYSLGEARPVVVAHEGLRVPY